MLPSKALFAALAITMTLTLGLGTAVHAQANAHANAHAIDPSAADANFDAIMDPQSQLQEPTMVEPVRSWNDGDAGGDESAAAIELSLSDFNALWDRQVAAARAQATKRRGPAVVLGATHYRGQAKDGALQLEVELSLTLNRPDAWKTVPLIGEGAVLIKAEVAGVPIGIAKAHGFHVWLTQETGEVVVTLQIIVPARGPRGSIEFDFVGPRTPVTTFNCDFPGADLEPRIDGAVQSDVSSTEGATALVATLRPTTRIHIVGFRDLGDDSGARARVYAETRSLVSIDDGVVEVFSEARYTILYAGTKRFDMLIPKGVTVVSAEGKGAFRYELEAREDGTLIRGETAFPIRDAYAISLRLRTEIGTTGDGFDVPLPKLLNVERDTGWLAVEVPGKLMLEESKRPDGFTAMDMRGLPADLVRSAVSPILMAYRVRSGAEPLVLSASRLPEKELASEQIDRIRAFTVVSAEGTTLTELRLTLRNRLRPSLAAVLPQGAKVRSVLLDGAPVKPSVDDAGRLLLPLKRSERSGSSLKPVTLQLVYEMPVDALNGFGQRDLTLPTLELPASSLEWSIFLPQSNVYDDLVADIEGQSYWTQGSWVSPRTGSIGGNNANAIPANFDGEGDLATEQSEGSGDGISGISGDTGAMPVRITLPQTGHRLDYQRYWLDAEQPVTIGVRYAKRWLTTPLLLLLMATLAAVVAWAFRRKNRGLTGRIAAATIGGALTAALLTLFSAKAAILAVAAGTILALATNGAIAKRFSQAKTWASTLQSRYQSRDIDITTKPLSHRAARWVLIATTGMVALALANRALSALILLLGPNH